MTSLSDWPARIVERGAGVSTSPAVAFFLQFLTELVLTNTDIQMSSRPESLKWGLTTASLDWSSFILPHPAPQKIFLTFNRHIYSISDWVLVAHGGYIIVPSPLHRRHGTSSLICNFIKVDTNMSHVLFLTLTLLTSTSSSSLPFLIHPWPGQWEPVIPHNPTAIGLELAHVPPRPVHWPSGHLSTYLTQCT